MESLSIITIPDYIKKELKRSLRGVNLDYTRFNIRDRKVIESLHLLHRKANDTDNSNVAYDGEVALIREFSSRGIAHKICVGIEGVGVVPIMFVEVYSLGQGLRGSVGRVDFYGGYHHFYDDLPQRYKNIYDGLYELSQNDNKICSITRIDVALDFNYGFPQNGGKWITPSKNSKREISCYRHKSLWNSYGYLSKKNSGYGVRMYNKLIDIEKLEKQGWYGGQEALPPNWTRIEFEFYPPYTKFKTPKDLMRHALEHITGQTDSIYLGLRRRPLLGFKVEKAYSYFERYAKKHGISMETLIDEIVSYHIEKVGHEVRNE